MKRTRRYSKNLSQLKLEEYSIKNYEEFLQFELTLEILKNFSLNHANEKNTLNEISNNLKCKYSEVSFDINY